MARPVPVLDSTPPPSGSELAFIAMPLDAYKALSEAAAKRGVTIGSALEQAISEYLKKEK